MLPLSLLVPFVLASLIWGYVFFRRTGLIGGCLATIATGSCLGHPFFHVSLITADRVLLLGLTSLYFAERNLLGLKPRPYTKSDVALILFNVCLVGSAFFHDWKYDGGKPVALLLFFYLMPLAMYWIASRCPLTERSHRWILGFFAVFGAYLSLTAICEVAGFSAAIIPRYIADPTKAEFLGRARGPFLNPIGNGMYLTAALIATLMCWPHVKKVYQPAVLALAGLICVGAACTLTRSVWLGAGMALVGMATLIVPRRHRLRVILVAAIVGCVTLGLTAGSLMSFKRDKHLSAKETEDSVKLRPILAAFAVEIFKDHPLTGVGLAQYKRHNIDYLTTRSFDLPMDRGKSYVQHNIFLSLLVETGLIGLTMFLFVLGFWIFDGWSVWHAIERPLWQRQFGLLSILMLAAYLPNGMFHELSVIPMLNMLMFFVAGLSRNVRAQPEILQQASVLR